MAHTFYTHLVLQQYHFSFTVSLNEYRSLHAVRDITGDQDKFTKNQSGKTYVFLCFRSNFTFGDDTYTVHGETSFLGVPAFLSRSSVCCRRRNFFAVNDQKITKVRESIPHIGPLTKVIPPSYF